MICHRFRLSLLSLILVALSWTTIIVTSSQQENVDQDAILIDLDLEDTQQQHHHDEKDDNTYSYLSDDALDDGIYDALSPDPSCISATANSDDECWSPPQSTLEEEEEEIVMETTCSSTEEEEQVCTQVPKVKRIDKHWGSDDAILNMRRSLANNNSTALKQRRPPVFLMPGLASTRLVAWKHKSCNHPLLKDVRVQDYVWLNVQMLVQMKTITADCWKECIVLGDNQTDSPHHCKLRPDEGLDAISSLAPGSFSSEWVVGGGTNTVYAWLIQWLADNLGYDVTSIVGLPYDWRLSPNQMQDRDGFLTLTKLRIEAAVKTNGRPGIMVAHSMGNAVFRYFLEWLRQGMRQEAYDSLVKRAEQRLKAMGSQQRKTNEKHSTSGWMGGVVSGLDELWHAYFDKENSATETLTSKKDDRLIWQLANIEGDAKYVEWLKRHIWSYVGLSAPLLGAPNPVRAAISGENMGLPISNSLARYIEKSFGSTHSCNPISSQMGFCDYLNRDNTTATTAGLGCLDDIIHDIESGFDGDAPWKDFPQLEVLLKKRVDWDSSFSLFSIVQEQCRKLEKSPCALHSTLKLGPRDAQNGEIFDHFANVWKEEGNPMRVKREQLEQSFWYTNVPNTLNATWDRPHIKHIIMAYGVDVPTEAGYVYKKTVVVEDDDNGEKDSANNSKKSEKKEYDGMPTVDKVIWEEPNGLLVEESVNVGSRRLTDSLKLNKARRKNKRDMGKGMLLHSGDGTIPYLSLSWAHTWLLHAARARMYSQGKKHSVKENPLHAIQVSHRPDGGSEWKTGTPVETSTGPAAGKAANDDDDGDDDNDTGTNHPHGTKYKPTMVRYHGVGKSRTTGMEYSTTVIEAIGVEHKETTRNYDILAAVFTDVLKHMHEDFELI